MTPTPEQEAIIAALSGSTPPDCLIISAGPGCAKTTTIAMAIRALPTARYTSIQCTAFNKEAVASLASKIPQIVPCSTLNSIGLRIWTRHLGVEANIKLEPFKTKDIIQAIQDEGGRWSILPEELDDLLVLVTMAKSQGWLPRASGSGYRSLCDFKTICLLGDVHPEPYYESLLGEILTRSIKRAFTGRIAAFGDGVDGG